MNITQSSAGFFALSPDHVLSAVEQSGSQTTGMCYALNSMENRVYEVELVDGARVVAKFYRPGRWTEEAIRQEHTLLLALQQEEIPCCPPLSFPDGRTVHQSVEGIFFALFPRMGGRAPDEFTLKEYEQIGRLIARIHNVSAGQPATARSQITPQGYGEASLKIIRAKAKIPPGLESRYLGSVERLIEIGKQRFANVALLPIHGDCHKGNLLRRNDAFFFLDFDDMGIGPAVQDLWLLLPARVQHCPQELESLLGGYQQFRDIESSSLTLIEVLRALRYVRYAAWVLERWDDASFPRAFPDFGTDRYWERQYCDINEQLQLLENE